jgi:D-threo-aldose 1-dehydrogenase
MKLREIGRTGLQVTPLGFGGAPLGNLFAPVAEADVRGALDTAWSAGCRFFDTAPFYGFGLSERRVGDALRERPREEFVLSTKVGRLIRRGVNTDPRHASFRSPMPFHVDFDYSYDGVMRSLEGSYQRLGLDRIDILLLHDIGRAEHGERFSHVLGEAMEGAYRALDELRRAGQIRAIGLGVNEVEVCELALGHGDFDCFLLAGRYTLLEQGGLEVLFPACQKRGVSLIVGGPFNSGILVRAGQADATYNYTAVPAPVRTRVEALLAVCHEFEVSLPDAALQFPLANPVIASVIPGARTAEEAASHWRTLRTPIPWAFWQALRERGLLHPAAPLPGEGGPGEAA